MANSMRLKSVSSNGWPKKAELLEFNQSRSVRLRSCLVAPRRFDNRSIMAKADFHRFHDAHRCIGHAKTLLARLQRLFCLGPAAREGRIGFSRVNRGRYRREDKSDKYGYQSLPHELSTPEAPTCFSLQLQKLNHTLVMGALSARQTIKLSPQPHAPFALGFSNTNPAVKSSSTQSIVDPMR